MSNYRYQTALETLETAKLCYDNKHYKDSINRSYYAAFYAIKAVLALAEIDFKRHKDAVAYFNKNYVRAEIFPREIGRQLSKLEIIRHKSDYDEFYIKTKEGTFKITFQPNLDLYWNYIPNSSIHHFLLLFIYLYLRYENLLSSFIL